MASEIDVERVEKALERAQVQLTTNASDLNCLRVEVSLARAQNRIKVASNL